MRLPALSSFLSSERSWPSLILVNEFGPANTHKEQEYVTDLKCDLRIALATVPSCRNRKVRSFRNRRTAWIPFDVRGLCP